jgi:hypothetical protein
VAYIALVFQPSEDPKNTRLIYEAKVFYLHGVGNADFLGANAVKKL